MSLRWEPGGLDSPILSNCSHIKTKGSEKEPRKGYVIPKHFPCLCPVEGRVAGPLGCTGPELPTTQSQMVLCRGVPHPREESVGRKGAVSVP